jgi:aromatic ring-opening dioxygenase catalytic subunit (LigB family)
MFVRVKTQPTEQLLQELNEAKQAIQKTTYSAIGQKMLRELIIALQNELNKRRVYV